MLKQTIRQGSSGLSVPVCGPIACIYLPHFAWQIEIQRLPELNDFRSQPILIAAEGSDLLEEIEGTPIQSSEHVVLDYSPGIQDVVLGMPIDEAVSRHKSALLIEADLQHYYVAFGKILDNLEQRIPDIESGRLGLAYIGIWGLKNLYGDDANVIRVLASAIPKFDLRIGVGENKWIAYIAAKTSQAGRARKVTGPPGRFMQNFSIDMLPISYFITKRLRSFGINTLGEVADISQGPIEAQFGQTGKMIWQLANGIDNRPFKPREVGETVSEYLMFPDITTSLPVVLRAIDSLLTISFTHPKMAYTHTREAYLKASIFRKVPWTVHVAFSGPVSSKNQALFAIKSKLETLEIPGPLEDLQLTLAGLGGEASQQESMWKEVQKEGHFREMLSQLQARLGVTPPIYQVKELEAWSRIPERRHALVQLSP